MLKKLKNLTILKKLSGLAGLILTIAAAVFITALSYPFFLQERLMVHHWNIGIDCLGGLQSGDGSLIDKESSTWYTAREVMTNAEESTDTCGEWNLSCHAPGNKLSANL